MSDLTNITVLNEKDAAKLIGIAPRTLAIKRKRENLPHRRICGRIGYLPADIAAILEGQKEGGKG